MGAKHSKNNSAINQKINGVNVEDVKQFNSIVILGTLSSGKSTVFKSLQWNDNDNESWQSPSILPHYIETIRLFCFDATYTTLKEIAIEQCSMDDMDETFKAQCQAFKLQIDHRYHNLNIDDLRPLLVYFWNQNIMKQTFEENYIYSRKSNIHYFINKIDEIFSADYKPSKHDILRAHFRTTGFVDFEKSVHGTKYRFCDIGGRRSERSKLLFLCSKETRFAIYVCGLDQYTQKSFEDLTENAMDESLALFDKIVHYKHLEKQQIILLLNKTDLFKECIQKISLKYHYDDYNGADYKDFSKSNIFKAIIKSNEKNLDIRIPHNIGMLIGEFCVFLTCEYWIDLCYKNGIEYIKQKYLKCSNSKTRILSYETCALNPEQIESVINDAVAHIVEKNWE